ncbi:energy transducer TonB [Roseateles sp. DC23W]|uniref:Energy transducer TonB n=1 Tax=Pelomonas dachongensis TaxID=3299029 RepID=A0ABW7EQE8_9BURK
MQMIRRALTTAALMVFAGAAVSDDSYRVTAVFDTLFDAQGQVAGLRPHDQSAYPAAFWEVVRQRVGLLRIPPPTDAATGRPATLSTGLYVTLQVTPDRQGNGVLKIVDLDVKPLVLQQVHAAFPPELVRSAGWTGAVQAECVVGTDGRCGDVKVKALPGMPQSLLRWARDTMELWEFEPPRLNGRPIMAPTRASFELETPDIAPVNFIERGSGQFRW